MIAKKRGAHNRLGFAVQLGTVRYLGTFLEDPLAVPQPLLWTLAKQLSIEALDKENAYSAGEQRWQHATEIRASYGYVEFTQPLDVVESKRDPCATVNVSLHRIHAKKAFFSSHFQLLSNIGKQMSHCVPSERKSVTNFAPGPPTRGMPTRSEIREICPPQPRDRAARLLAERAPV